MATTRAGDVAKTIAAAALRDLPPARSRITHGANKADTTMATAIEAVTVCRRLARSHTTMTSPTTAVTRGASEASFDSQEAPPIQAGARPAGSS